MQLPYGYGLLFLKEKSKPKQTKMLQKMVMVVEGDWVTQKACGTLLIN